MKTRKQKTPYNIKYARFNGFKNSYCHQLTGVENPATLLANFILSKLAETKSQRDYSEEDTQTTITANGNIESVYEDLSSLENTMNI